MNAHLKLIGRQALQQKRQIGALLAPEPVGDAPGLKRDVSLEVQKRRQKSFRRGIVNGNALQIAACRVDQLGRVRKCLAGDAGNPLAIGSAFSEPLPDLAGQRAAEIGMIEAGSEAPNIGSLARMLSASRLIACQSWSIGAIPFGTMAIAWVAPLPAI